jgi:hypothetical protein
MSAETRCANAVEKPGIARTNEPYVFGLPGKG